MKKRILSMLLVLVMAFTTFTACTKTGGAEANFDVPEGFELTTEQVTITFYHTMGENLRTVLDQYIAEFNKLYPNITIQHEQVGGYDDVKDQISQQITAGNQPNIAYCYPDHVAVYNMAKAVVSLDNLIASTTEITRGDGTKEVLGLTEAQVNDFIDGYYEEGRQFGDGLMYTLPMSKSTEVLYYNKTFFEKNNIAVPKTWDELKAVCEQIKKIDPNSIPLGYDSESNWFITMCEQLGTDYTSAEAGNNFLFNNDENKAFVKEFRNWYQSGLVTTQEIYGAYTSGLFTQTDAKELKSYMSIGSSAGAKHQCPSKGADGKYPFEVGIATIPQANANDPKVISQGPSLCIFQKADPQEVIASWLFVKFLTTNVDFQAEFGVASGYVPVLESVAENEGYKNYLAGADGGDNITALSAKVCMEQADAYYTSPAFNGSSDARKWVGEIMKSCLSGEASDVDKFINDKFQEALEECEYNQ